MEPAAREFAASLAGIAIQKPAIPVIQNVDAAVHEQPDEIRDNLGRQLYSPVQWVKTVQAMRAQGVVRIIEAGPGKVLAGLCKRIDKGIAAASVYDAATLDDALANDG
jgi:[acyl-carrier-protein] S-malonyltransferase